MKEKALRESEELYRSILRASPDDITVTDLEGKILLVSPAAVSMLGYGCEEELLGRSTLEFLAPEDRQRAEASIALMHEGVFSGPGEYTAVRADGSRLPIEVNGEFIRDADERPTGMVFVVRDVTQRKGAEKALRESEERFRTLFEGHRAVMLLVEPDSGQILDANAAAARFYGYSREQLRAMRIQQINQLPPEEVAAERHRAVDHTKDLFTFPHRLASGEVRVVEVYSTPVTIQGRPTLFSIIHDVTGRKQAEEALRESETRFDSLFESSPDAVFLTMPDGTILAANPAACALYGWSEDELQEKGRSALFEPNDPRLADVLEERRRTGRLRAVELLAIRKSGERFPIELDSVILPGEPERAFVIVRDVTERRLAEQALREREAERAAQQERGRLARDLHDSVTQALFAATLKAEALIEAGDDPRLVAAAAEEVRRLNRGALAQMRTLLLELRGDAVEAVPLPQLLRNVVEAAESRAGVKVILTLNEGPGASPEGARGCLPDHPGGAATTSSATRRRRTPGCSSTSILRTPSSGSATTAAASIPRPSIQATSGCGP